MRSFGEARVRVEEGPESMTFLVDLSEVGYAWKNGRRWVLWLGPAAGEDAGRTVLRNKPEVKRHAKAALGAELERRRWER
jgi:hypothetical protein